MVNVCQEEDAEKVPPIGHMKHSAVRQPGENTQSEQAASDSTVILTPVTRKVSLRQLKKNRTDQKGKQQYFNSWTSIILTTEALNPLCKNCVI
jgi:hypothetical protein